MRKTKSILALAFAVIMIFAMSVTSLAAGSLAINETDNNRKDKHTYTAYQIFKGTLNQDGTLSVSQEWGDDVDGAKLIAALKAIPADSFKGGVNPFEKLTAESTPAAVAEIMDNWTTGTTSKSEDIDLVATAIVNTDGVLKGTGTAVSTNTQSPTSVADGYYIIVDKANGTLSDGDSLSKNIIKVAGNATNITVKTTPVTSDKEVRETLVKPDVSYNGKVVDVNIGDTVYFDLTGTVNEAYMDYKLGYKYEFDDTMSEGLTFTKIEKVVLAHSDGSEVEIDPSCYTVTQSGQTLKVTFANLQTLKADDPASDTPGRALQIGSGHKLAVVYSAVLNAQATVGVDPETGKPNWNKSHVNYSNDPNGDGEGKTEDDEVYVYDFEIDVKKTDGANELDGAEFVLQCTQAGDQYLNKYATWDENGKVSGWVDSIYTNPDAVEGDADYQVVREDVKIKKIGESKSRFAAKGLDAGSYKLIEAVVPEGYKKAADQTILIEATYDADGKITGLTSNGTNVTALMDLDGTTPLTVNGGKTTTTVINTNNVTLPETGGIGTTIFYILGAILLIGGGVMLVSRRKASLK